MGICNSCRGTGASRWGSRPDDASQWLACETCKGTGGTDVVKKSYHFNCGNSTVGPLGMCGCVRASSAAAALEKFREAVAGELNAMWEQCDDVEYIDVYINHDAVTLADIDMIDDEDVIGEAA